MARHLDVVSGRDVPTQAEAQGVLENAIVRDERDAEAERGGGDPAIGIVLPLAERVTNLHAVGAEARVGGDELVAGVDDFDSGDLGVELPQTRVAPAAPERSVAQVRHGLERHERGSADDDRLVQRDERADRKADSSIWSCTARM